jgi:hypothetical protein
MQIIKELGQYIDGNGGQPFASGKGKNVAGITEALNMLQHFDS